MKTKYCIMILAIAILFSLVSCQSADVPSQGTAEATAQGLGTCILGWLDDEKIRDICGLTRPVRLVVTVGYAADTPREKKRKKIEDLVSEK